MCVRVCELSNTYAVVLKEDSYMRPYKSSTSDRLL